MIHLYTPVHLKGPRAMKSTPKYRIESPATVTARLDAYQARQAAISAQATVPPGTVEVAPTGRVERPAVLSAFEALVNRDNLVSLVDLRPATGLHRWEFDEQLRDLRIAGVLVLSVAEGRYGISEAELNAAIREHGEVLLYVSRRVD